MLFKTSFFNHTSGLDGQQTKIVFSMELNKIYNQDCMEGMKNIPDSSIDCILTDPPYLYLKGQKLDREFDELLFFNECLRVLKKDSFIVLFGRGTSFYRWNTQLAEMGFLFKEEIIWNKRRISSPVLPMGRVHETISIHAKGKAIINQVNINYGELKGYDLDKIYEDIKRLGHLFNKGAAFKKVVDNIEKIQSGQDYSRGYRQGQRFKHTFSSESYDRCSTSYSINSIEKGCKEQTIINDSGSHYGNIHPTQKPIRLIERLLALTTKKGDRILDPFSGSASITIAAKNMGRESIAYEIDKEYYDSSITRYNNHKMPPLELF